MSHASGIVGIGPVKKKTLDYIVPPVVYRHFAGQKPSKEELAAYIVALHNGTASPMPSVSPAPKASVTPQQVRTVEKSEEKPVVSREKIRETPQISTPVSSERIGDIKSRSTLSISHLMSASIQEENKKQAEEEKHVLRDTPFTQSALSLHWVKYMEKMKESGHVVLYTAMNDAAVDLGEKFHINISVASKVNATEIENEILPIMEYLKKELDNECITHEIIITGRAKERMPYTPGEKYEYLRGKNPILETMREKLKLNIEF